MLFSQLINADSVLLYFEGNHSFPFTVVFNLQGYTLVEDIQNKKAYFFS